MSILVEKGEKVDGRNVSIEWYTYRPTSDDSGILFVSERISENRWF